MKFFSALLFLLLTPLPLLLLSLLSLFYPYIIFCSPPLSLSSLFPLFSPLSLVISFPSTSSSPRSFFSSFSCNFLHFHLLSSLCLLPTGFSLGLYERIRGTYLDLDQSWVEWNHDDYVEVGGSSVITIHVGKVENFPFLSGRVNPWC